MAINPGDLATVVESGANGTIMHIDSDGSDSGTFHDVRLTGAGSGGSFPAGDVVRCARAEIDAPHGHYGKEECCEPLPWWWSRPVGWANRPNPARRTAPDRLPIPRTPGAAGGFSKRSPEMNQTEGHSK